MAEGFGLRRPSPIFIRYFDKANTFLIRTSCKSHPHAYICLTMVVLRTRHSHPPSHFTPGAQLSRERQLPVVSNGVLSQKTERRDLAATTVCEDTREMQLAQKKSPGPPSKPDSVFGVRDARSEATYSYPAP